MSRVSDPYSNGDIFHSICVSDFVFEESGVLWLKRAEGREACITAVHLVHLQKASGTSVTEAVVSAATVSLCTTAPR